MKKSILALGVILLFLSPARAQFQRGDFEFSLSGSSGSGRVSFPAGNRTVTEARQFFHISIAPAYYVGKGTALEAEIGYAQQSDETPTISALSNLSYNFLISDSRFVPFVRAGIGIASSLPLSVFKSLGSRLSEEHTGGILNLSAGVKILLVGNLMARVELNHRSFKWFDRISGLIHGSPFGSERTSSNTGLVFGLSFAL